MTTDHLGFAKVVHAPSAGNERRGVVLHATRVGTCMLRTERELATGKHLYYVDNVPVGVNDYLEIVRRYLTTHG